MTIVKQMSLAIESSSRFDAIFATFDVQAIFQLFSRRHYVMPHVNLLSFNKVCQVDIY